MKVANRMKPGARLFAVMICFFSELVFVDTMYGVKVENEDIVASSTNLYCKARDNKQETTMYP